jgi:homoserine dehydrogenase
MQRHEGGYYIRFSAIDQPGTIAAIAKRMAERQISLESVMQKSDPQRTIEPGGPVPVVLITYATTEQLVREALDAIVADGTVAEKPQVIRIERQ